MEVQLEKMLYCSDRLPMCRNWTKILEGSEINKINETSRLSHSVQNNSDRLNEPVLVCILCYIYTYCYYVIIFKRAELKETGKSNTSLPAFTRFRPWHYLFVMFFKDSRLTMPDEFMCRYSDVHPAEPKAESCPALRVSVERTRREKLCNPRL